MTVSPVLSADALLAEFGARIGMPGLKFDANACCQLAFDERWLVTLTYVAPARNWVLSCPLAARQVPLVPASQHAMLRANFMGAGSGGGYLAIAPDGRPCLQIRVAHGECDGDGLLERVESLLNLCEVWAERLCRGEMTPGTEARASGGGAGGDRPPSWMLQRV